MASAVIGALRANLSLNTAEFQKGVSAAKRSMGSLQDNMKRIGQVASVVATGLGAMAASSISTAKEISNLSRLAGATPKNFQRWSAAAKSVGVDQEKLSDQLKDVRERIGEFAATGKGEMTDWFDLVGKKIGVTIKDFQGLSGPEALQLYYDGIEKAGASTEMASFLMENMGDELTALMPLLKDGGAELKRLADQAEASGAIMSNAQIASLKKAGAAIALVKKSWAGMQNSVSASLAPTIERVANALAAAMQEGGVLNRTFNSLANNIQRLATYVATGAAGWAVYKGYLVASTVATMGLSRALGFLKVALIRTGIGVLIVGAGELIHRFIQLRKATGSAGEAFSQLVILGKSTVNALVQGFVWFANRQIGIWRGAFAAVKEIWSDLPVVVGAVAIASANATIRGVELLVNGVNTLVNGMISGVNKALSMLPDWAGGGGYLSIPLVPELDLPEFANPLADQAQDAGRRAADAFAEGFGKDTFDAPKIFDVPGVRAVWKDIQDTISGSSKEATDSVAGINDELFKVGGDGTLAGLDKAKKKTDELSDAAKMAKDSMGKLRDAMSSAFASTVTGASSARDAVAGLLRNLADMAANSAFQKLFNSLAGNGINGTGSSATPSIFGQAASWLFGGIGQNANGTDNWRGGLSWVGERGPELLNIPRGSQVYNSAESRRMAQGGGGTLRILVEHSEDSTVRILEAAGNQAVEIVEGGLQEFSDHVLPGRQAQIARDPMRRG